MQLCRRVLSCSRKFANQNLKILAEKLDESIIESTSKRKSKHYKVDEEPITVLHFVAGQRGNPKLLVNGFYYIRNKGSDEAIYWRCATKRSMQCKAKAVTNVDMNRCKVTHAHHNHPPDEIIPDENITQSINESSSQTPVFKNWK